MRKRTAALTVSSAALAFFMTGLMTAVPAGADTAALPNPNPCAGNNGSPSSGTISICTNSSVDPPNTQGGNNQTTEQCPGTGVFNYQLLAQVLEAGGKTFPVQSPVTWSITGPGTQYVYLFGTAYPGGVPTAVSGWSVQTPTGDIDGISSIDIGIIQTMTPQNYGFLPPPPGNPEAPLLTHGLGPINFAVTATIAGYGSVTFSESLTGCSAETPFAPAAGGIGLAAVAGGALYLSQRRRRRSKHPVAV